MSDPMTTEPDRLEALKEALEPFARAADEWDGEPASLNVEFCAYDGPRMNPSALVADFRHARDIMNTPIETNSRTGDTGGGLGASASPTVATHEPSPSGLGPTGECQLAVALAPFARVAAINAPLSADWPDSKPNPEFVPTAWPGWGDFKRALETLDAVLPNWREETDRRP